MNGVCTGEEVLTPGAVTSGLMMSFDDGFGPREEKFGHHRTLCLSWARPLSVSDAVARAPAAAA